jgi:hypothetical protein
MNDMYIDIDKNVCALGAVHMLCSPLDNRKSRAGPAGATDTSDQR